MNKAILIGRLTRDPELRYTSSNRAVCQFSVAIDRPFTNQATGQREADFINVVVWDKQAENVGKYVTKGRLVAVEGRIQTRNYDNNEGRKVYVTEIVANSVQFLESKNSVQNNSSNNFNSMPEPPMASEPTPYDFADNNTSSNMTAPSRPTMNFEEDKDPFAAFGESVEISDNDLPF